MTQKRRIKTRVDLQIGAHDQRQISESTWILLSGDSAMLPTDAEAARVSCDSFVWPDLMVICGPIPREHVHETPVLIAETLSPSTHERNETFKRELHCDLRVRHDLIVDPESNQIRWISHDNPGNTSDAVDGEVNRRSDRSEVSAGFLIKDRGLYSSTFYKWKRSYGRAYEHNSWIPRDHWLLPEETQAIIAFREQQPIEGYRRLAFMMLDQDTVAVSPSTVQGVLHVAGLMGNPPSKSKAKGSGFDQPTKPHQYCMLMWQT